MRGGGSRAAGAVDPGARGLRRRPAAFASDLDRTLIRPGRFPSPTARSALREARGIGLRVLLVSGRERTELEPYVRALGSLDGVVAENGAVVEAPLGSPPVVTGRRVAAAVRRRLAAHPELRAQIGQVMASVARRDGGRLRRLVAGLPVRLVANVDRLMVLPVGVDKRRGTRTALRRLGLAGAGYAAIGDAENDGPLLDGAALSGAVGNAERPLRRAADYVCRQRYERGVLEFVRGPLAEAVHRVPPP